MLGGVTPIVTVLGAAPEPDAPLPILKSYARALCQIGLHVLLVEPGGKTPVDMRSAVARRKDDAAAQEVARSAGRPHWATVKSKAGVYLATDDEKKLASYLKRYRDTYGENAAVNFGIAVGPSRLVVVDCDTAEQVHAFLTDSAREACVDPNYDIPPTVRTPGKQDPNGNWIHSDGGHFYFTAPEGLPLDGGSMTVPGGYAILWDKRFVLIPPSIRPEGSYRLLGQDYPLPQWIADSITARIRVRARARADASPDAALMSAVDSWALSVSWDDLLAPHGWIPTARQDGCGCDIWTAPGDHASPKSATAHDTGCSLGRYTPENAPLHIWTDHPGPELEAWIATTGSQTLSRLQVIAALSYGGNVGEAMRALEVLPNRADALAFGHDLSQELGTSAVHLDTPLESGGQIKSRGPRPSLTGTPPQPQPEPSVPLRVGDQVTLDHILMLEAQGFTTETAHVEQGCVYTFTGPETDGRVLTLYTDSDHVIGRIAVSLEGDSHDHPHISLTPLPEPEPNPFVTAGSVASTANDTTEVAAPSCETVAGVPLIMPFDHWRDLPPPQFVVDGLIEHQGFTALIGAPGIGKTGVALDLAAAICLGRRWMGRSTLRMPVGYLPGEGMAGAVDRLRAWESAHGMNLGQDLFLGDSIIQVAASPAAWQSMISRIMDLNLGLLIVDTFARAAVGLEENSAKDVGQAVARFDQVRKATGVGLLVVHHTGKSGNSGRGSSALNGALDTELLVTEGDWWAPATDPTERPPGRVLDLVVSKQKNAAQPEHPLPMLAVPYQDSFIMTGPSGVVNDPLDSVAAPRAVIPEPVVSVAIRIQEYLGSLTMQGATRGEIAYAVYPDAYTAARRDPKTAWRMKISEAVDLGLRYQLIRTLTGAVSGARYVPDVTTAATARQKWIEEAMPRDPME